MEWHGRALMVGANASTGGALAAFLGYTLVVVVLGWLSHRVLARKSFLSEYFLGSRSLGPIALTLTLGATAASAGSFAGFPSLVYTHGWVLALWISSYMVVPLCVLGLFGKRLNQVARKSGAITLPDVLRDRFNSPSLATTATLLMVFMLSFYLVPQFKLAALILQELLQDTALLRWSGRHMAALTDYVGLLESANPDYLACLLIFAILVVFYTTLGGFRAVVWTDVMQGFVMVAGVLVLLALVMWRVGGLSTATEKLSRMIPPRVGEIVFERSAVSEQALRIPDDTWLLLQDEENTPLWIRTNQTAVIPRGDVQSNSVRVVQIVTPEEIADVKNRWPDAEPPPLPAGVTARIQRLEEYAYGAGQRGVYLSAPGPSPRQATGFLPLGLAISFFVYYALSTTGQPGNMVRLMAYDSSRTLKRSIVMLTLFFGMIYFPLVVIFCSARAIVPGLDQSSDRIMPVLTVRLASDAGMPWLAGLLIAAPFAAAMSTVDSFMLMVSSSLVRDIYQRNYNPTASERRIKWLSYGCMIVVGCVVTLAAANPPQFMQYIIVFAGGGLSVVFLIPMGLALYWPRVNQQGMLASMIGGLGVYLALYAAGFWLYRQDQAYLLLGLDPIIWGYVVALVAGILVSLTTAAPPLKQVQRYFARSDAVKRK